MESADFRQQRLSLRQPGLAKRIINASLGKKGERASPLFDRLTTWVNDLGELATAILLTTMAMLISAVRRKWLESIFILLTTSSVLVAFVLKEAIHRTRPFLVTQNVTGFIQSANQYRYPRGHVLFFVVGLLSPFAARGSF